MEINYDELFGLNGEEETEAADPSAEEETAAETEETAGEKESEPAEQTGRQSKEENAKYAAIRRKAEEEASAKAQKQIDDAFAALNMVDPYTGKPIKTKADFEAYQAGKTKEKTEGVLEKTGWTEDELKQYVDELPDVKAAKQAKETYERMQQKQALDTQIAELGKIDSAIKSVEDLQKQDNYRTIYEYVLRGLNIVDAYKLANFDKLSSEKLSAERASSAARQAALNSKSKEHLQPTTPRGEGAATVPADVMEYYKALNPTATVAEITAHYNKNHQKG